MGVVAHNGHMGTLMKKEKKKNLLCGAPVILRSSQLPYVAYATSRPWQKGNDL